MAAEQIAYHPDQISQETKVYIGSLVHYDRGGRTIPIFDRLKGVERVYPLFPEGEIVFSDLTIGGMKARELRQVLRLGKFPVAVCAQKVMKSEDFQTLPESETIKIVRLPIGAICPDIECPNTRQLYQHAEVLGLEKCPGEVGPHQRLKDVDQPMNTKYYIAMKPITFPYGYPSVFRLEHRAGRLRLDICRGDSDRRWSPDIWFAFTLRKNI